MNAGEPIEISLVDFPSYRWGGGPKVTIIRAPWLGAGFFKRLSDAALVRWAPSDGVFHEGNFSACNKEIERRAARAGMKPLEWCAEKRDG